MKAVLVNSSPVLFSLQIEEKAMEELLLHYKAKDNPAEYITVERIRTAISTPIWKIDDKS